jgi:hypothetical protein
MAWPPVQPSAAVATDVTAQTTRHADDHNKLASIMALLTPGAWNYVNASGGAAPAFTSPWANFGGTYQTARFRREGGDICRFEACIAGGTSGTTIFTLPVGFRPASAIRFPMTADATPAGSPARLDISQATPGVVALTLLSGSGTISFVSLFVTFSIDPASL